MISFFRFTFFIWTDTQGWKVWAFYKLLILNQVLNQFSYLKGFQLDLVNLETSWRKYLLEISGIFIRQLLGHSFKQGQRYNIFVKERPNNRNKTTYCKFVKNNTKLYSAFADFKKSNIDASYHHMQQYPRITGKI